MPGWIKLHRQLLDKPVWQDTNAAQKAVLITILLSANFEIKSWIWRGKTYNCEIGQFVTSINNLADKAKVSRQTCRSTLERLKKYGLINIETNTTSTIITVCNYEKYQGMETAPNTAPNTRPNTEATQKPTQDPTPSKKLRSKEVKKERHIYFGDFWEIYPKRVAKTVAEKAFEKLNPDEELIQVILADIEKKKKSTAWTKDGGQFIPNPSTYLNQKRWADEDMQYKPKETPIEELYKKEVSEMTDEEYFRLQDHMFKDCPKLDS